MGERSVGDVSGGRSASRLVVDRVFGPFLLAKMISQAGLWGHNLVSAIVAWEITRSATVVGLVSLAQFGPQVLLSSWSGVLADRADRVRQLLLGRAICSCSSLAVGLWFLGGVDRAGSVSVLLACSVLMGVGLAVGGPALLALVPSLVERDEIPAALRLDSAPMLLGRTLGPAGGAVALATLGVSPAFFIAAASNLLFGLVVHRLRRRVRSAARTPSRDGRMRAALGVVREDRHLLVLFVGVAATTIGSDPSLTLAPAVAHMNGVAASGAGTYTAAFGLGAALAVAALGFFERVVSLAHLIPVGLGLLGLATAVSGLPLGHVASAVAFGLAGFGMSTALTGCTTLIQLTVEEQYRGRVMSLWLVAFIAPRPISALLDGVLADLVSLRAALLVVAASVMVAAWACRPSRIRVGSGGS